MTVRVSINEGQAQALSQALEATAGELRRARRGTVNRVGTWAHREIRREIAKRHNVPQRALRERKRTNLTRATAKRPQAFLWFGIMPLRAGDIGKPRKVRGGVRSGRHRFEGAFLATMRSGHVGAFKRRGRARLKIDEQSVPLSEADAVIARMRPRIMRRLQEDFAESINKATAKRRGQ